jgi:hypothetical protein
MKSVSVDRGVKDIAIKVMVRVSNRLKDKGEYLLILVVETIPY